MGWLSYAIKRVASSVGIMWGASVLIFGIIHLVPGDPAQVALGRFADQSQVAAAREAMGLTEPLHEQYVTWLLEVLSGEWGQSLITDQSVAVLLAQRYPKSIQLALFALVFASVVAIPLGISGAIKRDSATDYTAIFFSQLGMSVPNFWLGILMSLLLARFLGVLPPSGYTPLAEDPVDWARHLIMPAIALGLVNAAVFTRYLRSEMLEHLNKDYVTTARAFGHPERRIVWKYVLRNALIPFITIMGLQFGWMVGGVVVIEEVFSFGGVGQLILGALLDRDYPVIQMSLLALAGTYLAVNLIVDLVYGFVNPKIKY